MAKLKPRKYLEKKKMITYVSIEDVFNQLSLTEGERCSLVNGLEINKQSAPASKKQTSSKKKSSTKKRAPATKKSTAKKKSSYTSPNAKYLANFENSGIRRGRSSSKKKSFTKKAAASAQKQKRRDQIRQANRPSNQKTFS